MNKKGDLTASSSYLEFPGNCRRRQFLRDRLMAALEGQKP